MSHHMLIAAGYTEEELQNQDLDHLDPTTLQTMIKQRLLGEMINNGATQKIVSLEEVEPHIKKGWEFVATLPNGKAILKLPKIPPIKT